MSSHVSIAMKRGNGVVLRREKEEEFSPPLLCFARQFDNMGVFRKSKFVNKKQDNDKGIPFTSSKSSETHQERNVM